MRLAVDRTGPGRGRQRHLGLPVHRRSTIPDGKRATSSDGRESELKPHPWAARRRRSFSFPAATARSRSRSSASQAATGVPSNRWTSIGQILEWQLRAVFPDRQVHANIVAASGNTLEGQHAQLYLLTRRPDVLLIYCGHNEFSTRFDSLREPRHYFDEQLPTAWSLLVERIESVSPLCGLIRKTADKCRVAIPPPPTVTGPWSTSQLTPLVNTRPI